MTKNKTIRRAFTLVELLTVLGIIVLLAAIALPSIVGLYSAGADAQAYNLLAAQLAAARALAIQESTFAGVHVQLADAEDSSNNLLHPKLEGQCFSAIMVLRTVQLTSTTYGDRFVLADGYIPRRIPGGMAFGELSGPFISGSNYDASELGSDSELQDFTSFTIIFSPSGAAVKQVNGLSPSLGNLVERIGATNRIDFAKSRILFPFTSLPWGGSFHSDDRNMVEEIALWELVDDNAGATAVTLFDYAKFRYGDHDGDGDADGNDRRTFLNESGQFLPINVYTGQLFRRQ